jgi:predicted nucleic acid-binding Zn ribbon protein
MAAPTVNANYCPNCGSLLGQDVNYCSQCGTQCREVTPASDDPEDHTSNNNTTSDDRDDQFIAFRNRVQSRLLDGWDIEHDYGDSVVLVDREIGSLWIHAPLLLFTGGVGNLAYEWYSHSYNADRMIMQSDGTDYAAKNTDFDDFRGTGGSTRSHLLGLMSFLNTNLDDVRETRDGGSVGSYLLGSLLFLIGVSAIVSSPLSLAAIVFGLLTLTGAAWTLPPTRRRLKNRHPVTRFGSVRSTDEETVTDPNTPCVVCASSIEEGIKRTYREEYAIAGVPLFTTETGENHYCRECAGGDIADTGIGMEADRPTEDEGFLETEHEN